MQLAWLQCALLHVIACIALGWMELINSDDNWPTVPKKVKQNKTTATPLPGPKQTNKQEQQQRLQTKKTAATTTTTKTRMPTRVRRNKPKPNKQTSYNNRQMVMVTRKGLSEFVQGFGPVTKFMSVLSTSSPWYNRTGWLGVKHQLTYLLTLSTSPPFNIRV